LHRRILPADKPAIPESLKNCISFHIATNAINSSVFDKVKDFKKRAIAGFGLSH
jgi:hypothetical protein